MKNKTLKQLREAKGLTQEQASKILEISKGYISMMENGERNPSDKMKEKLAKLYGVEIYDIFLACKETHSFKKRRGGNK